MNLLLVTTRNLSEPTGEWRLISQRSTSLRRHSVFTDVLYLTTQRAGPDIPNRDRWIGQLTVLGYSPVSLPWAFLRAAITTRKWLGSNREGMVMLSGVQTYPLAAFLPRGRF